MEVAVSSSRLASAVPSSSGEGLLTLFSPGWNPSHGRQSSMNFSNVRPSCGLQFFTKYSSVGPFHEVQPFMKRLLQCGSPTRSQVLPVGSTLHGSTGPAKSLLQVGFPQGHSLLWAYLPAPLWTSIGCRRTAGLTVVFTRGCRGICSGT